MTSRRRTTPPTRRRTPATAGRGPSGGDLTHVGEDVAFLRGTRYAVATGDYDGSTGSSMTTDGGRTWKRVSRKGYHTIDCVDEVCWAAGSKGRVGRG